MTICYLFLYLAPILSAPSDILNRCQICESRHAPGILPALEITASSVNLRAWILKAVREQLVRFDFFKSSGRRMLADWKILECLSAVKLDSAWP